MCVCGCVCMCIYLYIGIHNLCFNVYFDVYAVVSFDRMSIASVVMASRIFNKTHATNIDLRFEILN